MKFSKKIIISFFFILLGVGALAVLIFSLNIHDLKSGFPGRVLWRAFVFTIYQALLSALISVCFGLLAAPGYARLGRWRRFVRWVFLIPNLMSSVLVVLCLLLTFSDFPYGIWGIIIGHVFMSAGLCTVWLGERWLALEEQWLPVTRSMGTSSARRAIKIVLPLLWPQIQRSFAVVFSFCLVSFAVPLILGGGPEASTLEVLIYELIHSDANISWAVLIGLLQSLIQVLVFLVILKSTRSRDSFKSLTYLKPTFSLWHGGPLLVGFLSLYPLIPVFQMGIRGFSMVLFTSEFFSSALLSVEVAIVVFFLTFFLLSLLITFGWARFLIAAPTVSGVVVGLAGILFFKIGGHTTDGEFCFALICAQMSVIFLPVFRLSSPAFEALRLRFERVFTQLGVDSWYKFKRVYFKLGFKTLLAGSGLAACWSMGDFSVARTLGFAQNTLPVYVQNLLGSYRLEQAAASSLLLFGLTFVSLLFVEVLSDGLV